MNIIAIETATTACALGFRRSDGFEVGWVVDDERHHTETLVDAVAKVLDQSGLRARDLDRVVVDRGPGLFTGLRVGLATALGLSESTGAAVVAVTSLELLAHGAWRDGTRGTLVAVVDARRGEVFVQTFELGDEVRPCSEPEVTTAAAVASSTAAAVTFTGDGVQRYHDVFASVAEARLETQLVPSVSAALEIGATREAVAQVHPLYLREADAVANFSTRERS